MLVNILLNVSIGEERQAKSVFNMGLMLHVVKRAGKLS